MSEKNPNKVPPVAVAAGNGGVSKPAETAAAGPAEKIAPAPVVQPVAAGAKPPELFGGHRGGGKKRADGLVAGSPEAIAVDKEKDRLRVAEKRAGKAVAALPPTLPGATPPPANAAAALAAGASADVVSVAGAAIAAPVVALPRFVEWTLKPLERLVKVATKIADRLRVAGLMSRLKKIGFDKETKEEAEKRFTYKAEQVADFNAAVANATVIELNKRRVPGGEHSHWLEVLMTGGELVSCHLDTVDWLEKKLLEKAEREQAADVKKN